MLDKNKIRKYYGFVSIIPVDTGAKTMKDKYWSYKRYSINDIDKNGNIAMHTGTEVLKNRFSLVLDVDFDMNTEQGKKVLNIISMHCSDTVIVKSGGKHNGLHVHYLTNIPASSGEIISKYGIIEIKAIDKTGRPSVIILPPSIVDQKYRVIHPERLDYINFRQVKQIGTGELREKLQLISNKIKNI